MSQYIVCRSNSSTAERFPLTQTTSKSLCWEGHWFDTSLLQLFLSFLFSIFHEGTTYSTCLECDRYMVYENALVCFKAIAQVKSASTSTETTSSLLAGRSLVRYQVASFVFAASTFSLSCRKLEIKYALILEKASPCLGACAEKLCK